MTRSPSLQFLDIFLVSCLLSIPSHLSSATEVGGTIQDALGRPLPHAYVTVIRHGKGTRESVSDLHNRWAAANDKGEFQLNLSPGQYKIRAKAEADGYPDPTFWLNTDPLVKFPTISVGESSIRGLQVTLLTRDGILDCSVVDKLSGNPLAGAKVRLLDPKNSYAFVEVFTDQNGHFQFTVVSKPIVVSAAASGHKQMTFRSGEHVIISPGEHRLIEFELDPERP
jgi:5-hydroxyisourate hydrolase-like protein (transthyretin family)